MADAAETVAPPATEPEAAAAEAPAAADGAAVPPAEPAAEAAGEAGAEPAAADADAPAEPAADGEAGGEGAEASDAKKELDAAGELQKEADGNDKIEPPEALGLALQSLGFLESRLAELEAEEAAKAAPAADDSEKADAAADAAAEPAAPAEGETKPDAPAEAKEGEAKEGEAKEGEAKEGEAEEGGAKEGEAKEGEAADAAVEGAPEPAATGGRLASIAEAQAAVREAALEVVEQLKVVVAEEEGEDEEWSGATAAYDAAREALATAGEGGETAPLEDALKEAESKLFTAMDKKRSSFRLPTEVENTKGESGPDPAAVAALEAELAEAVAALAATEEAHGALAEDADDEAKAAAQAAVDAARATADEKQAALDALAASGGGDAAAEGAMDRAVQELEEATAALAAATEEHEAAAAASKAAAEAAEGEAATDEQKAAVEPAAKAAADAADKVKAAEALMAEKQAVVDELLVAGMSAAPSGTDELADKVAALEEMEAELATLKETLASLQTELEAASEGDDTEKKNESAGAVEGATARQAELEDGIAKLGEEIATLRASAAEAGAEEGDEVDPDLQPPPSPEVEEEEEIVQEPEIDPMELIRRKRELVMMLHREQANQTDFIQRNTTAQAAIAEIFRRKQKEAKEETAKQIAEQEERYSKLMGSIEQLEKDFEVKSLTYKTEIAEVTARRDEVQAEVEDKQKTFYSYKRKIAKQAVSSKTGKAMKDAEWHALEVAEKEKDNRVRQERLKYIKLRNQLRMREAELKEKEQLAEGLHFIDFEQLKIENQTYNEKIEERNEELSKLRSKITMTVQVLSHLKEKLHFVEDDNVEKRNELLQVEAELAAKRDQLSRSKRVRDKLRRDNQALVHECGLIGKKMLLRDFENQYEELEEAKKNMTILQARYAELVQMTQGYKERLGRLKDQEPDLFRLELPPLGRD